MKMKNDWESVDFGLVQYRDTELKILSAVDDIQMLLDDHVVKTHTMKGSPFIEPFVDEIDAWENKLVGEDKYFWIIFRLCAALKNTEKILCIW